MGLLNIICSLNHNIIKPGCYTAYMDWVILLYTAWPSTTPSSLDAILPMWIGWYYCIQPDPPLHHPAWMLYRLCRLGDITVYSLTLHYTIQSGCYAISDQVEWGVLTGLLWIVWTNRPWITSWLNSWLNCSLIYSDHFKSSATTHTIS